MKSITVIAYNRPKYLDRVLTALGECRGVENYSVCVSLDDGGNQPVVNAVARSHPFDVFVMPRKMGVDSHPQGIYEAVFDGFAFDSPSEFNVVIEDDVVPAPDALELCDWFFAHPRRDDYVCLCLHSHSKDQSNPLLLHEEMRFNSWGWAFTSKSWKDLLLPEWNQKPPTPHGGIGWDWSVGLTIQRHGLKVLRPELSRTLNIGRENGTYETPDHWDEWAKDLTASDGTHGADYFIVEGYDREMDGWAKEAVKGAADETR